MKKKNREREEKRTVGPFVHTKREREILEGTGTVSTSMELTDRPDLASARDRWQR